MNRYEIYEQVKKERRQLARDQRICTEIIDLICFHFNVTLSQLSNCTRKRAIMEPRQLAMNFLRRYTTMSLAGVGEKFNRDHSTVIHGSHRVDDLKFSDRSYRMQWYALDKEIQEMIVNKI